MRHGIFFFTCLFLFLGFHFCAKTVQGFGNAIPLSLNDWQVAENARFDDPEKPCLQREGPVSWQEHDEAFLIDIRESLPCQTVLLPKDEKYFGLRRFALSVTLEIDTPGHDHNLLILWKDRHNFTNLHFIHDRLEYEKIVGGVPVYSVSTRLRLEPRSKHRYKIEHDLSSKVTRIWQDEMPVMTVIEPASTPDLPPAWVGLRAAVGAVRSSRSVFSHFIVENLGDVVGTTTPLIKQNDPLWKNEVYDRANLWAPSQATLSRWGCALTSAVMVLHGYGIQELPNGEPLWPDSLNDWLLEQSDGYFGEGHLNWRALTRLAAQLAQKNGSTKLEFLYASPREKLPWLREMILSGKPVILDMGGHFVAAHQTGPGEQDFAIHDPLFPLESLRDYKNTFLSARLFVPSQTDLSAVTLIAPLDAQIQLFDENDTVIRGTHLFLPSLKEGGETLQLLDWPKLDWQKVSLHVQTSAQQSVPLTIFSYSPTGEMQHFSPSVAIDKPEGVVIDFLMSEEGLLLPDLPEQEGNFIPVIASPHIQRLIDRWQQDLLEIVSSEKTLAWEKSEHWLLTQGWKHNWLTVTEYQVLLEQISWMAREKFP